MRFFEKLKRLFDPKKQLRRGAEYQRDRREVERWAKKEAVSYVRFLRRRGGTTAQASFDLGMSRETLFSWVRGWKKDRLAFSPRGRPARKAGPIVVEEIRTRFDEMKAKLTVPALQALYPEEARNELRDLLEGSYRDWYEKHLKVRPALSWREPGWVWAIDYTEADAPIDGEYPYILYVRDLGSRRILRSQPVTNADSLMAAGVLSHLFLKHGPPLVLKSDNGSHFKDKVTLLLEVHDVVALFSPKEYPQYNGGAEAGIGALQYRMLESSIRAMRPGILTCDDLLAAEEKANQARSRGPLAIPPSSRFEARRAVRTTDRRAFRGRIGEYREVIRAVLEKSEDGRRVTTDPATVERKAIAQALIDLGVLRVGTRRISQPIFRRRRARIK